MKWYLRLDVVSTVVMVPLAIVLCQEWGIPPNLDLVGYAGTSVLLLALSVVPVLLLFLGVRLLRGEGRRLRTGRVLLGGFLVNAILLTVMSWVYSHIKAGVLLDENHDADLARLGRALFGDYPWALCRQLVPEAWGWVFHLIYMAFLPVLIGSVFWLALNGKHRLANDLSGALVVAYYLGALSYHLLPSYGPAYHLGGASPAGLSDDTAYVQQMLRAETEAVRRDPASAVVVPWRYIAAFPSLHVSHVLILVWYARRNRLGRALAGAFALLTAFSTIYLGWHYLADLIGGAALAGLVIGSMYLWRAGVRRLTAGAEPATTEAVPAAPATDDGTVVADSEKTEEALVLTESGTVG